MWYAYTNGRVYFNCIAMYKVFFLFSNKECKTNTETIRTRNGTRHFFILVDLFPQFLFLFLFYFKCKCSYRSSSYTSKRIRLFKRKPLFSNKCTRDWRGDLVQIVNAKDLTTKKKWNKKKYINYLDLSNHFSSSLIFSCTLIYKW